MNKNTLIRTNTLICIIIILGFVITSKVSYFFNKQIFDEDKEQVSKLTLEGIYHEIDSIFTKPIHISTTMANDSLLKNLLHDEKAKINDKTFLKNIQNYLETYRIKYNYDSVFLVSTATNRYYHYKGLDRILSKDNTENQWYYNFINKKQEYAINIDNDEVDQDKITIFVNCRILDEENKTVGIVGVGFNVNSFQNLLYHYESQYDVKTYLVDKRGIIQLSSKETSYQNSTNLFKAYKSQKLEKKILSNKKSIGTFWHKKIFFATRYIDHMGWYLIINNDTTTLQDFLNQQMLIEITIISIVIIAVLFTITKIIRGYNEKVVELALYKEKMHRNMFLEVTEKLYENIYELDITHNCPASKETQKYFEKLGVPQGTPYDQSLHIVAEKQIKEEFRNGYIKTFSPEHILKVFAQGQDTLVYDFMISNDSRHFYWMRITASIFKWEEDGSIRMFTYRQNIDEQKKKEKKMLENIRMDALSSLYNKQYTQEYITTKLESNPQYKYAFFILDIDNFKKVNDNYGHAIGDKIIRIFSSKLKQQFDSQDFIGRIGGDEFVAFISFYDIGTVEKKAKELVCELNSFYVEDNLYCSFSSSIGISLAPYDGRDFDTLYQNADKALYQAKKQGRNRYVFYHNI